MVGNLTTHQIDQMLLEQSFARLGCHADGRTYVVPISFARDGDSIVGQTTHGLKIEMMRKNPHVCIEIDDVKSLTEWKSVILWGRYEELTGIEAARAMGLLIDRYGIVFEQLGTDARRGRDITPPRSDATPTPAVVYRIHIVERTGRFERSDS